MMSIIAWMVLTIDINLTNMTGTGMLSLGFQPYIDLLGSAFWGILFGFPAAAIYVNSERKYMGVFGYLTLIGLFFTIILPVPIAAFFGMILTLIVATLLYKVFVETRS